MTSSSSVTPLAGDLWYMVSHEMPLDSIRRFAALLESQGLWTHMDPTGPNETPLAIAWLDALTRSNEATIPDVETLTWLLDGVPDDALWSARDRNHQSLAQRLLSSAFDRQSGQGNRFFWLPELWHRFPKSELERYRSRNSEPSDDASTVFRAVVQADQTAVAKVLLDRGWSWNPPRGTPVGTRLQSPAMWELFLATGGNPMELVAVESDKPKPRVPLWESLLASPSGRASSSGLPERLRQWGAAHDRQRLDKKDLNDYWKSLGRTRTQADVLQAVRARKDWADLRNENGQSPIHVALYSHVGIVEALGRTAKGKPLLAETDRFGWNLWHHLLAIGKTVGSGAWEMARAHAPCRPNPSKGLLVTLYLAEPSAKPSRPLSFHESLPNFGNQEQQWSASRPGNPSAEDWWAGTPAELARLGRLWQGQDAYLGSKGTGGFFSFSREMEALSFLARIAPPPEHAPPELLGALVLAELVTCMRRGGADRFALADQWLAQGAVLAAHPKMQEQIEKALPLLPQDAGVRFQTLALRNAVAPAAAPSRRFRI